MARTLRSIVGAVALGLATISAAHAAFVEGIVGQVSVDFGQGFVPVTTSATLKPGDRIMVGPNSSAQIQYPGGCFTAVIPGKVSVVGSENTCTLANQQATQGATTGTGLGTGAVIGGAALIGGAVVILAASKKSASP